MYFEFFELKSWHGGKFCVSIFRQNQEYHVFNVHGGAYSPWLLFSRKGGAVCAPLAACMPTQPFGNAISRGLAGPAVGEQNLQLAENHVPILAPGMPMFDDSLGCQIQHPPQGIVVGERWLGLGNP